MNLRMFSVLLALGFLLTGVSGAADADTLSQWDNALRGVVTYQYGNDAGPLDTAERIVVGSAADPVRRLQVEKGLMEALTAAQTREARDFLCRQLLTVGTAQCVPVLEALLTDPESSHMARYALGRIQDPAAVAALRRAAGKTSGVVQAGIIGTLGDLQDQQAVPELTKALGAAEVMVAEAAAVALGKLGGPAAVEVLQSARAQASAVLQPQIDHALMACADQFLAAGQPAPAIRIYQAFYAPGQPRHLRVAALRGLLEAGGPQITELLTEAIQNPDLQPSAIGFARTIKGPEATRLFAELMPSLPAAGQALLVRALEARGDARARPAIVTAARSENEAVRLAGLEALGTLGDRSTVGLLVNAAASASGREQEVAQESLVKLHGDGVETAMLAALNSAEAPAQVELIRALARRKAVAAVEPLRQLARAEAEAVRRGAIEAMGGLVNPSQINLLIALVVNPRDASDRAALEDAVAAALRRMDDPSQVAGLLLRALAQAPSDARPSLVRLAGRAPQARTLGAVRGALNDPNPAVQDAAVRTLSEWPDPAPADVLLNLVQTTENRTYKVLALRGYVRMAGLSGNPTAMYQRALELAERPEDKKLVLAGLGTANSPEALTLVESHLQDPALQVEAALAVVQVAGRLRQNDPSRAKEALQKVLALVPEGDIRNQAQAVVNEMEQYEGYILTWLVAGPYTEKGKDGQAVFQIVFPPENAAATDIAWQPLNKGIGSWDINLGAALDSLDHCAAYLQTRIWSPQDQEALLELGSDDAIKAWLGGREVHAHYTSRGLSPRQDLVKIKLQQGWNPLLLKVVNNSGGWACSCRVRQLDGSALAGLRVETPSR